MVYFSVPLLIMGWFVILIILALLIRSVKRKMFKFTKKSVKLAKKSIIYIDKITYVKVSTKDTFRRPLRFTSQKN